MVWANSILLAMGGLLVGVPILVHLMMRPKPKSLLFPALRFVRENQKTNRRSMRLRHWLLLVLRALLILIPATALAGPSTASNRFGSWVTTGLFGGTTIIVAVLLVATFLAGKRRSPVLSAILGVGLLGLLGVTGYSLMQSLRGNDGPVIGDQRAPVAAVILIDTSPRMQYRFENQSSLERAQEMADWLIGQFPPESQVAVVATDEDTLFYSVDIQAARKRVQTFKFNFRGVALPERIATSLDFLEDAELSRTELYVLSDLTAQSWSTNDRNTSLKNLISQFPDTGLYVVDIGTNRIANYSVDTLKIQQSAFTQKDSLKIECGLTHQTLTDSESTNRSRVVRLKIEKPDTSRPLRRDGRTLVPEEFIVRETNAVFDDQSNTTVQFDVGGLPEGVHHGVVEIEGDDGLAIDDARYLTIEVKPAWPVLLIRSQDAKADFLEDVLEASGTSYKIKTILEDEIGNENLEQYRAVFWLDPTRPTDTTWEQVRRYVDSGGSFAIFAGPGAEKDKRVAENFLSESALQVMPATLTRVFLGDGPEREVFLSPDSLTHPILAVFRQVASSLRWSRYPVFKHWGLNQNKDDDGAATEVIVRYSNGNAALVERRVGSGRVLLLTTPLSPSDNTEVSRWNDLTVVRDDGLTYLLFRMLGEYLVSTIRGDLNYAVGEFAILPNDDRFYPERYRVFSPRNEDPGFVNANDQLIRYRFTDTPGHYRLKGRRDKVVLRGFSVNLAERSTDMTRLTPEELEELIGKDQFSFASDRSEVQREQGALRIGREFYPLLVLLLVVVIGLELLFSNFFYSDVPAIRRAA